MKNKLLVYMLVLLGAASAYADDIALGEPSYGGSGCPAGTASATLSPDAKVLSVLFDQYIAEAGASVGKSLDRKSCNLAIPVHIPQGYSVSILKVDYRGFVSVPRGGSAQFSAEYFLAGSRGPSTRRTFRGPTDEEYMITDRLLATAEIWSACGADVNLRVNSSMLVRSNRQMDDAIGTVDSTDVDSKIVYHLQWRRCR